MDHVFLCSGLSLCQTTSPLCCLYAKIHKLESLLQMATSSCSISPANSCNGICSESWHPHPFIQSQTGSWRLHLQKLFLAAHDAFSSCLRCTEMKKLGYITGSGLLLWHASFHLQPLPSLFLRRAFRKIKIGGTIKRKKLFEKKL